MRSRKYTHGFWAGIAIALIPLVNGSFAATVDVSIANFAFTPNPVTIQAGDTVRWTNQDATTHTATSGTGCAADGKFGSLFLGQGQTYSFQFSTAGQYPYFCMPHCTFMSGTVIVEASGNS